MYRGYVKIWRKFQENELWRENREFSKAEAWIDLLMEAQHQEDRRSVVLGNSVLIQNQGETLKSLDTWAKRWSWTKSKVRRFLDLLQRLNMIRHTSETKTTRITILNYKNYNEKRNANETQTKRKRHARDNKQECNNGKNVENKEKNTVLSFDESFEIFCEAYPVKVGKKKCREKFDRLKPDEELFKKILSGIEKQKIWRENTNGEFRPEWKNPLTWLNHECWDDEIEVLEDQRKKTNPIFT
ncbi:hypothetical protein HOC54_02860 [Candidatus Peregrinibacteria bacterium]|jgi:hypothetical protein|nr:hypothetical protein [Candidatus Peregrinibacteria bacterium]